MRRTQPEPDAGETRGAVALTIAWMLTSMSTAVAMLVVLALHLLMIAFPAAGALPHPLGRIAGVLHFVALLTGIFCVALAPLAYRVRRAAPPRAITTGVVLIGISPIVLLLVLNLLRSQ